MSGREQQRGDAASAQSAERERGGDAGEVDADEQRDDEVDEEPDEQQGPDRPRRHPAQALQRRLLDPRGGDGGRAQLVERPGLRPDVGARAAAERGRLQVGQHVGQPVGTERGERGGERPVRARRPGPSRRGAWPGRCAGRRRRRPRPRRRSRPGPPCRRDGRPPGRRRSARGDAGVVQRDHRTPHLRRAARRPARSGPSSASGAGGAARDQQGVALDGHPDRDDVERRHLRLRGQQRHQGLVLDARPAAAAHVGPFTAPGQGGPQRSDDLAVPRVAPVDPDPQVRAVVRAGVQHGAHGRVCGAARTSSTGTPRSASATCTWSSVRRPCGDPSTRCVIAAAAIPTAMAAAAPRTLVVVRARSRRSRPGR